MLSKRNASMAVTSSSISSRMLPGMLFFAESAGWDPKLHSGFLICIAVYRCKYA